MTDGTDKSSSAEIIPFPSRTRSASDGAERLDRAMRALEQANAELRDAVAAWRGAIDALGVSVGGIAESLQILDTKLMDASLQLKGSDQDNRTAAESNAPLDDNRSPE